MLRQKLILGYATQLCTQFSAIVAGIVVARVAGPSVLGTVAFGAAYVAIWSFVADLGFGSAHIKLISEGQDIARCNATYIRIRLLTTATYTLFIAGFYLVQKFVFGATFASKEQEYVIGIFLLIQILTSISMIPQSTFVGLTEQAKRDIPLLIENGLLSLSKIGVVLLGGRALGISLATLVPTVLLVSMYFYLFRKYEFGQFDKKLARRYVTISAPIFLIALSMGMASYLDRVMLGFFCSTEQVGYYTAGYRLGGLIQMVGNSVGLLFFPAFSAAFRSGNFDLIRDRLNRFERFSYIFIFPLVLLSAIFAYLLVSLVLGEQYQASVVPMALLNFAMFFYTLAMPYGNVLTGKGLFGSVARTALIYLGLVTILNVVFLSGLLLNLNATGAALAMLLGNVFLFVGYQWLARYKSEVDFVRNHNFLLFGVIQLLGLFFLHQWIREVLSLTLQSVMAVVYLGQYLLLARWLGLATTGDFEDFISIFRLRQMKHYVTGELFGGVSSR